MPDVFRVLRADHAEIKRMLLALEKCPGLPEGAGKTLLAVRHEVARRLVMYSSRHEAAEEEFFWPVVRDRLSNGNSLAVEAAAQERQAREVLARLTELEPDDEDFDQLIAGLLLAVREHIEYEETRIWPGLRAALSQAEAQDLGRKVRKARERPAGQPPAGGADGG
jgi:hemerythrin-like domain-containing protein